MKILRQLGDWRFSAKLRSLERQAGTDGRARALTRRGYGLLNEAQRLDFLGKAIADLVAAAPEDERQEVYWRLQAKGAGKLNGEARRNLPTRWLSTLAEELRPRMYLGGLRETLSHALSPLDRTTRQTAAARIIEMLAVDHALEQQDLTEVLAPGDHTILLGPWTMEVGFELLYWIPLLRRYLRDAGVPRERVVAISRGGVGSWYEDLAGHYVELFDFLTPDEYRALGAAIEAVHDGKKPFTSTAPEQELVARVAERLDLPCHRAIYPAALYGLFRTTWLKRFGGEIFLPELEFAPISGPLPDSSWPRPSGLPFQGSYVAVKLYSSEFFAGEPVAPFAARLVATLARRHNVVLLNTGLTLDDHGDIAPMLPEAVRGRVFDATPLLTAADNLAVQSALVANADKLYCTFGGFSYLGPLLGVDTFSFFTHTHFVSSHLDLALRAFNREGYGSLAFLPVTAMDEAAVEALAGGHRA